MKAVNALIWPLIQMVLRTFQACCIKILLFLCLPAHGPLAGSVSGCLYKHLDASVRVADPGRNWISKAVQTSCRTCVPPGQVRTGAANANSRIYSTLAVHC